MTKNKGFTLIEIIVALALFSAIVAIAVGGFARALHAQKEASDLIAVQSSAGVALEQVAREIRTGYLFCVTPTSTVTLGGQTPWTSTSTPELDCATQCVSTSTATSEPWICSGFLHFYNAYTEPVSYSLGGGSLLRNGSPITSENVHIASLSFILFGQLVGDHWNPRITIAMGVAPSTTDPAIAGDITNLETTVSAREPDQNGQGTY